MTGCPEFLRVDLGPDPSVWSARVLAGERPVYPQLGPPRTSRDPAPKFREVQLPPPPPANHTARSLAE
jgi:hypothetical protein